jgi:hypothetical protein
MITGVEVVRKGRVEPLIRAHADLTSAAVRWFPECKSFCARIPEIGWHFTVAIPVGKDSPSAQETSCSWNTVRSSAGSCGSAVFCNPKGRLIPGSIGCRM